MKESLDLMPVLETDYQSSNKKKYICIIYIYIKLARMGFETTELSGRTMRYA